MNRKYIEQDVAFMQEALKESEKALQQQLLPVGAVLVINNEIVGRSHKDSAHSYHLDHAEIMLVRDYFKGKKIDRNQYQIALYTTLEPCIMCLGTILHLPVGKIVYAAKDPYGGGCGLLHHKELFPIRHHDKMPEVVEGVLEAEAKDQLKRYLEITDMPFYKDQENPW